MTKIKICGLKRIEDIQAVNELGPDYVGFVFVKGRKRYISPEQAEILRRELRKDIPAVGVFIDEDPEVIAELVKKGIIQLVQLHGTEDEVYIKRLREACGPVEIIRAFQIKESFDPDAAMESSADLLLLDAGAGFGKTFDWTLVQNFKRPYFLAGGISAENAPEAIRRLNPLGLDVSSSLENDGVKDPEKMRRFVETVRETC